MTDRLRLRVRLRLRMVTCNFHYRPYARAYDIDRQLRVTKRNRNLTRNRVSFTCEPAGRAAFVALVPMPPIWGRDACAERGFPFSLLKNSGGER